MNFLVINTHNKASLTLMINGRVKLVLKKESLAKIKNCLGHFKLALGSCVDYIKKIINFF